MVNIIIDKADKVFSDEALFISFNYDVELIAKIKSLPTRMYHPDTRTWEVPYTFFDKVMDIVKPYPTSVVDKREKEKPVELVSEVDGFEFKTKPFQHQLEGFNYGLNHDRWLLGDEQGLGKTKSLIDIAIAKKLLYGYKHCLIICGVNGLKWNWQSEIATHSNETGHILGQRYKKGRIKIGSMKDKLADLDNIDQIDSYFLITNIESLRNKDLASKLFKLCKNGTIGLMAVDEIHKAKNPGSQQGKGLLKLQPKERVAMTGTPLMNHPLDLYIILRWLGYESHSYSTFRNYHCVLGGSFGNDVIGYRNMEELQTRLNKVMLRRLKKDVLDLPDKTYIDEYVDMGAKQQKIYNEILLGLTRDIDKIKASINPLSHLIRLRQATGYTGILSTTVKESAKFVRMEEIVEEAVENGQKVVIFSNWLQVINPAMECLSRFNPVAITGETPDNMRKPIEMKFQNDNSCKVILGTIGAMGTGLTLTAGTVVIFLDEPWTMANKEQAVDRCHRIGTKNNVTIYTLLCKDTIDEKINAVVKSKGAMSDFIVDGNVLAKEELLDFLLS